MKIGRLKIQLIALSLIAIPFMWSCSETPTDESETTTPILTVAPDYREVSWAGNTYGAGITSTSNWVIESKPIWVECSRHSGTANQPFDFTVSPNEEKDSREGQIRLHLTDYTQVSATIDILQEAKPETPPVSFLYIEPDEYNAPYAATNFSCVVEASADWDFYTPAQDWLTLQKQENSLKITIEANESPSPRAQVVTLRLKDNSKTFGYKINQVGKEEPEPTDYVKIDNSEFEVTLNGGEINLPVFSNTWWTSSFPDRLTVYPKRAYGNCDIKITIPSNTVSDTYVIELQTDSGISTKITVKQLFKYQIGDLYPNNDNPEAVVFWVSSDESEIKVMHPKLLNNSLQQVGNPYDGTIGVIPLYLIHDEDDGRNNATAIIEYKSTMPSYNELHRMADYIANAASNFAPGYYIPAINELKQINDCAESLGREIFNAQFQKIQYVAYVNQGQEVKREGWPAISTTLGHNMLSSSSVPNANYMRVMYLRSNEDVWTESRIQLSYPYMTTLPYESRSYVIRAIKRIKLIDNE